MADIGEIDSGLNFDPRPSPLSTHTNWLVRKFEDMTMASEASIKGQTMGLDVKAQLYNAANSIILMGLANETDYLVNHPHELDLAMATARYSAGLVKELLGQNLKYIIENGKLYLDTITDMNMSFSGYLGHVAMSIFWAGGAAFEIISSKKQSGE